MESTAVVEITFLCRLCANKKETLVGIFSEDGISNNLAHKINSYLPITVTEDDSLPLKCCWNCASILIEFHKLTVVTIEAQSQLEEIISKGNTILNIGGSSSVLKDPVDGFKEEVDLKPFKTESFAENNIENDEINDLSAQLKCEKCNSRFIRECDLSRHTMRKHAERKSKRRKFVCDICNKGYLRRCDLLKHKEKMHDEDSDFDDLGDFVNNSDVEEPGSNGEETAANDEVKTIDTDKNILDSDKTCVTCNVAFETELLLKDHLLQNHGPPRKRRKKGETASEYYCDVCKKGFTRKFDMLKHRRIKHPNAPKLAEESSQNKNAILLERCKVPSGMEDVSYYKCENCEKIFHQSYNFLRHQTIHTGVRPYFCHICGKNFRVSGGLKRHINEHHYGLKRFPCDICGKKFAAKSTLADHKNIHTNNRPFVCDVCGKAFKQKASLHIHKLFHTDVYRFPCNVCGKKYRRATDLKLHSYLHTGQKPHECKICGSLFRLRQDLKRHLKIHDKLNEYVCTECGATFSQDRYLQNHKKTHKVKKEQL